MIRVQLGAVAVLVEDGRTLTNFGDGHYLAGSHEDQPGQAETAAGIGMTVAEMNAGHDLLHSLLAYWLGLPHSPALYAVAHGGQAEDAVWRAEEGAVLAVQAFAKTMNVDLLKVAEHI